MEGTPPIQGIGASSQQLELRVVRGSASRPAGTPWPQSSSAWRGGARMELSIGGTEARTSGLWIWGRNDPLDKILCVVTWIGFDGRLVARGKMPVDLILLSDSLEELHFSWAIFSGNIPTKLGMLSQLRDFALVLFLECAAADSGGYSSGRSVGCSGIRWRRFTSLVRTLGPFCCRQTLSY